MADKLVSFDTETESFPPVVQDALDATYATPATVSAAVAPKLDQTAVDARVTTVGDSRYATPASVASAVAPKLDQAAVDARVTAVGNATYATQAAIATAQSTSLLRTPTPSTRANPKVMVGAFAAGHGWTASGGGLASSNLNDTADFFLGTQSVKLVSLSTSGTSASAKTGLALDATGCDIRIFFKYDSAAALSNMKILLGAAGLADRYEKIVLDLSTSSTGAGYPSLPGDWCVIDVPFSSFATIGSPTRSAIDTIQINILNKSGQPVTVQFGGVALVPTDELSRWPNGVVTLTFDDSYVGQWTNGRTYLDKFGLRGTFFPIVGSLGGSYFTLDNLKALRDQGHEIGAHATSSAAHTTGIASLSESARRAELEQLRQWQADNGFNSTSYAYPNGDWSRAAAIDVARYYDSARLAFANFPGGVRPEDQYRIRAVNGGSQQASLNGFVDQAKAGKGWLNVVFHDIVASGATGNNITTANFQAFVDYCIAQGVPIRTQGEVMAKAV